jgi:hypothetical protein
MNAKKIVFGFICSFIPICSLKADVVDWSMIGGSIYSSPDFSSIVASGTTVRFGTFGIGFDFSNKSYSDLDSAFEQWAADTTNVGGQFYSANAATTGPNGTPWYIFVGTSPLEFGIFSNPAWINSGDPFPQYADLSDPGTFAAGGFGVVGTGPNLNNVALVPEPSSAALLLFGGAVFLFLRNRKVA